MDFNNPSTLDNHGHEILDQTPVAVGVHFERPIPLHIRIRQQLLQLMEEQSSTEETFKDADDFDVEDDDTLSTPYEMEDDFDHLMNQFQPGGAGGNPPDLLEASDKESTTDGDTTPNNE